MSTEIKYTATVPVTIGPEVRAIYEKLQTFLGGALNDFEFDLSIDGGDEDGDLSDICVDIDGEMSGTVAHEIDLMINSLLPYQTAAAHWEIDGESEYRGTAEMVKAAKSAAALDSIKFLVKDLNDEDSEILATFLQNPAAWSRK